MIYALILAGGSGTRFWPLSRSDQPKQFLNLCSNQPMIGETILRIQPLVPAQRIFIATNKGYHKQVGFCLSRLRIRKQQILFEPTSRNTFAPIAVISKKIYELDKSAVILVLPCDHYIKDGRKFTKALKRAVKAAEEGYIVTLGIKPDKPETGYGYIRVSSKIKLKDSWVYGVERFVEKPDSKRAKKFLTDPRYFWNGGIFVFSAKAMMEETKRLLPRDYSLISKMLSSGSINRLWRKLTPKSIDYAIMEKTSRMALVMSDFGWVDLGSLNSLENFSKKDGRGNIFRGRCVDIDSANIYAWSPRKLLATIGLKNVIIVDTDDALLVCAKERSQEVKAVVEILKRRKLNKLI